MIPLTEMKYVVTNSYSFSSGPKTIAKIENTFSLPWLSLTRTLSMNIWQMISKN